MLNKIYHRLVHHAYQDIPNQFPDHQNYVYEENY